MIGLRAEGGGARADINEFMVRHKKTDDAWKRNEASDLNGAYWCDAYDLWEDAEKKSGAIVRFRSSEANKVGRAWHFIQPSWGFELNDSIVDEAYRSAMFPYQLLIDNWKIGSNSGDFQSFVDVLLTSHKIGNYRIKSGPLQLHRLPEHKTSQSEDEWWLKSRQ